MKKNSGGNTGVFNMRLSLKLLKGIKAEAHKLGLDKSQFVRRLIIKYFNDQDIKAGVDARKSKD